MLAPGRKSPATIPAPAFSCQGDISVKLGFAEDLCNCFSSGKVIGVKLEMQCAT
jgi:hypothetical protein